MSARSDAARLEIAAEIAESIPESWRDLPPLDPGVPQFPRTQYLYGANKQAHADLLADALESFGPMTQEQMLMVNWLRLYGGVVDVF